MTNPSNEQKAADAYGDRLGQEASYPWNKRRESFIEGYREGAASRQKEVDALNLAMDTMGVDYGHAAENFAKAEKNYQAAIGGRMDFRKALRDARARCAELEATVKGLRKALEFYADDRLDGRGCWQFRKKFVFDIARAEDVEQIEAALTGTTYYVPGKTARSALAALRESPAQKGEG